MNGGFDNPVENFGLKKELKKGETSLQKNLTERSSSAHVVFQVWDLVTDKKERTLWKVKNTGLWALHL